VASAVHEFGCVVFGGATDRFVIVFVHVELTLAEVSNLDVAVALNQHVLGFQVALNDVARVQLGDGDDALRNVEAGHVFVKALALGGCNVEEEFASVAEVHHEANLVLTHEALVHLHEKLVFNFLQQSAFVARAFDLLEFLDCTLLQRLERLQLFGLAVQHQLNTALRPLTNFLHKLEIFHTNGVVQHLFIFVLFF